MEIIEKVAGGAGVPVVHARRAGARVDAAGAYRADPPDVPDGARVVRVECDWPGCPADAVVIDHHRPGDPGYGAPPEHFLPASSVGQAIAWLGDQCPPHWPRIRAAVMPGVTWHDGRWVVSANARDAVIIPAAIVLAAAADHCLSAAYAGACPGVRPDALMQWRAESRAMFQRRSVAALLADVERAREALRMAPQIALSDVVSVRDVRGRHIPELPEAAARDGECFVADGMPGRDGRIKVVCQSGTPEQISAFMEWAPRNGIVDLYGDPARGFAGGYILDAAA
jgi:hypothetical protein